VTGYVATLIPTGTKIDLPATQTSYTFTGLDSGQTYSVQVAAKSASGNGVVTQSAGAIPTQAVAGSPVSVAASASAGTVTVTWEGPANNRADGFAIDLTGGGTTTTKRVGAAARSVQFTGLTNGATYSATVRSELAGGAPSSAVSSNSVVLAGPPSAPGSVTATASSATSVTLSWTAATANGSAITGYSISGATVPDTAATATSVVITGLTIGQPYTFGVRAVSAAGAGPVANAGPVTLVKQNPDAPGGVSGSAGDAQVTVSWSAAAGNATTISSYVVTGSDGATVTVNGSTLSATLPAVNGTAVTYSVIARGANGLDSPASAGFTATPSGAPSVSEFTVSAASATSISVMVTYPPSSNGTTVQSLVLTVGGTDYPLSSLPYTVTGLTPATAYSAVLTVTGANGKSSSLTRSVTTLEQVGALTGLTYTPRATTESVTVRWTASVGATSYRIVVDGAVVNTVTGTSVMVGVTYGLESTVTVIPVGASGAEGASATIYVSVEEPCGGPRPINQPVTVCK
jgi:large repetitive protein